MAHRLASLHEDKFLRVIVATVVVLGGFVTFTEMTLRSIVPILVIFVAVEAHNVVDEMYALPAGSNGLAYGASVFIAGVYVAAIHPPNSWIGGLLALVGLWFVFDGVTIIKDEPSRTEHEYVSDLDDEMGEVMHRMQTLNVVYQALRDTSEPKTATELATDLDLTESRVGSALGFLQSKGRIEQVGNQYRAEPPRWGRVTPVVQFLVWLPRRVSRPFRRVATNA